MLDRPWEIWKALNAIYNARPGQIGLSRRVGPYGFYRLVRERAAVIASLTESTMSRDDAWRFLVLGRSLERTDMLARLLATGLTESTDEIDWVPMLRSCSAHEAFLRTYSREPEPRLAADQPACTRRRDPDQGRAQRRPHRRAGGRIGADPAGVSDRAAW